MPQQLLIRICSPFCNTNSTSIYVLLLFIDQQKTRALDKLLIVQIENEGLRKTVRGLQDDMQDARNRFLTVKTELLGI